ncbi:hypothetical protein M2244_001825 [Rhodoferax antarcticus]|nr:hypothetical protein [Rhodoferax antarcticus]
MTISFRVRGTFPSLKACPHKPFAQVSRKEKRGGGLRETCHRVSGLVQRQQHQPGVEVPDALATKYLDLGLRGARAARPQRCQHHHDLYPCAQNCSRWHGIPIGFTFANPVTGIEEERDRLLVAADRRRIETYTRF